MVPSGSADAMFQHAALIKIQLQAAAAEIENQPRLHAVAQRPLHGGANQARFFLAADHFQFDSGFSLDAIHQAAVIARFARRGGGHGAIGADVVLVHAIAELAEGARGAGNCVAADDAAGERVVAQAHRGAFAIQNFECAWEKWRGQSPDEWRSSRRQWLPIEPGRPLVYRQRCDKACEGR